MLGPHEEYGLPTPRTLKWIKKRLKDGDALIEDLFLALADFPVEEITPVDKELLKANIGYWRKGHAVPMTVVRELGGRDLDFQLVLRGDDIAVEPDVNYDYAKEFAVHVEANEVLDVGSGFGWIPALLSSKARVYALDKAYLNKITYEEDRIGIEGTNIELFPGSPTARAKLLSEKSDYRFYADFARLFWRSRGAVLENITQLMGDAAQMRDCLDLTRSAPHGVASGSAEAVTCFFSLNHIPAWRDVLREVHRVLAKNKVALVTLYKERLERFPVKFVYDWVEQLGVNMIDYRVLIKYSRSLGFKAGPIATQGGDELYYLLRLKKIT